MVISAIQSNMARNGIFSIAFANMDLIFISFLLQRGFKRDLFGKIWDKITFCSMKMNRIALSVNSHKEDKTHYAAYVNSIKSYQT